MGDADVGGDEFLEELDKDEPIENINPNFLMHWYFTVTTFLASYGWFLLFGVVLMVIIWSNIERKVKKAVAKVKSTANGSQELSPEVLAQRAEAMELARQRMQEKASAVLKREAERRKELEEMKKSEKLDDYAAMKAGRSSIATQRKLNQKDGKPGTPSDKPKPRPLRDNDYNPLTGTSSSSTRYRPAPRSGGGG